MLILSRVFRECVMVRRVAFSIALLSVVGGPAADPAVSPAPSAPRAAGDLSGFSDVREVCLATAATIPAPQPTAERDPSWSSDFHIGLGTQGALIVCATPYEDELVAGGIIGYADQGARSALVRWDGSGWETFADGLTDGEELGLPLALAVYRGDLIAAGGFTVAGSDSVHYVARWDGSAWQSLGGGTDSWVLALTHYRGDLIAGGFFTQAGEITCSRLARWDGEEWHRIGGVGGTFSSNVNALTVCGDDLTVGGDFAYAHLTPASNIARWDGEEWHALGEGSADEVRALGVYHGQLVAAGSFALPGCEETHELARWDRIAWRPLTGASDGCGTPLGGYPYTLAVFDDRLYTGGRFGRPAAGRPGEWRAGRSR